MIYNTLRSIDGLKFTVTFKAIFIFLQVFNGNSDVSTVVKNVLPLPTRARYVRFIPVTKHSNETERSPYLVLFVFETRTSFRTTNLDGWQKFNNNMSEPS